MGELILIVVIVVLLMAPKIGSKMHESDSECISMMGAAIHIASGTFWVGVVITIPTLLFLSFFGVFNR